MIGLDTCVLVRYIVRDDPGQTAEADALIATLSRRRRGYISPVALAELWWVLGRSYRRSPAARVELLAELVEADELKIGEVTSVREALAMANAGADFADALIAAAGKRAGCAATATFDRGAIKQ